jgi:hypothetical protein
MGKGQKTQGTLSRPLSFFRLKSRYFFFAAFFFLAFFLVAMLLFSLSIVHGCGLS